MAIRSLVLVAVMAMLTAGCSVTSDEKESTSDQLTCSEPARKFARQAWVTSGDIDDVLVHCNTIYVAGYLDTIGRRTGPLVAVSKRSAKRLEQMPELSGDIGDIEQLESPVRAVVADGQGGWFIGGSFSHANGRLCAGLLHLEPDGQVDQRFCRRTNGAIRALFLLDHTLYVGGSFTRIGDHARGGLAAVNASTGTLLPWEPRLTRAKRYQDRDDSTDHIAMANVITGDSSAVYVGGFFSGVGEVERRYLVALDPHSPRVLPFDAHLADASSFEDLLNVGGSRRSLSLARGSLFVGCPSCSRAGVPPLLRLDPESGFPRGEQIDIAGAVLTLVRHGPTLYIGGTFDRVERQARANAAAIDLVTNRLLPWRPVVSRPSSFYEGVRAIHRDGSVVYVGGSFAKAGGRPHANVAAFDARTGTVLPWDPGADRSVLAIGSRRGAVILGGRLGSVNVARRTGAAAIDGPSGRLLEWAPRIEGRLGYEPIHGMPVHALLVHGTRLYVGGNFSRIDGQPRRGLAAFDLTSGRLAGWAARIGGDPIDGVTAIAAEGSHLYVGGDFTRINNEPRAGVAALETASGDLTKWDPRLTDGADDAQIHALSTSGDTVYVGGEFDEVGDAPQVGIAAVDADSGRALDWSPAPQDLGFVYAIAATTSGVYVGGWFSEVGGERRTGIALIDDQTGFAKPFDARLMDAEVGSPEARAIVPRGRRLFIGGDFHRVGRAARAGVAAVDIQSGRPLAWHLHEADGFTWVDALDVGGQATIAGGYAGGGNAYLLVVQPLTTS